MNFIALQAKWAPIKNFTQEDHAQFWNELHSLVHSVNTTSDNIYTVIQINTIGGRILLQVLGSYLHKDQADALAVSARKGVDNRALKKLDARIEIKVFPNRLTRHDS